jgi:hypothetical protein
VVADYQGSQHQGRVEHDPEKWIPVFEKDHAQKKSLAAEPLHQRVFKYSSMQPADAFA